MAGTVFIQLARLTEEPVRKAGQWWTDRAVAAMVRRLLGSPVVLRFQALVPQEAIGAWCKVRAFAAVVG